jgi:hypothetical protein
MMASPWASPHAVDAIRREQDCPPEVLAEEQLIQGILSRMNSRASLMRSNGSLHSQASTSLRAMTRPASATTLRSSLGADRGVLCYPRQSPMRQAILTRSRSWRSGPQVGILKVVVQHAYGIEVADLRGTSDPYFVVRCGGQMRQTTVQKRTLDPRWDECLEFTGLLDDFLASGVQLTLRDWDGDSMGSDDVLGEVERTLDHAMRLQHGEVDPLNYVEPLSTQGEVAFSIEWVPKSGGAFFCPESLASPKQAPTKSAAPGMTAAAPAAAIAAIAAGGSRPQTPQVAVALQSRTRRIKVPVLLPSKFDFVQSTYERFAIEPPASANKSPYYKNGDPPVRIMYGTAVPKFTVGTGTYQIEKPQLEPRFGVEPSANARAAVQKGLVRPPSATMFNRTAFESPWTRHAREHSTLQRPY